MIESVIPVLNVSDLAASFAWFAKLGWEKQWDWGDPPDFGAVAADGMLIFLSLGSQGGTNWLCVNVNDVDAVYQRCVEQGIAVPQPPTDYEWHMREMAVRHPDGHVFRIGHGIGETAHAVEAGPPLPIERVDVPVRLERRLAGLLADLAAHKGMSLSSCLEEILLHTNERLGGGVASPHTPAQLAHIQELKRRHAIDYDSHASYRFVERSG